MAFDYPVRGAAPVSALPVLNLSVTFHPRQKGPGEQSSHGLF